MHSVGCAITPPNITGGPTFGHVLQLMISLPRICSRGPYINLDLTIFPNFVGGHFYTNLVGNWWFKAPVQQAVKTRHRPWRPWRQVYVTWTICCPRISKSKMIAMISHVYQSNVLTEVHVI